MLLTSRTRRCGPPMPVVHHIEVKNSDERLANASVILRIATLQSKIIFIQWGPLDETIITGHEDSQITTWNMRMGMEVNSVNDHTMVINDIQMSKDGMMLVSISKHTSLKLFGSESLSSPIMNYVALGGGQYDMEITTPLARVGKFTERFFHLIYEEYSSPA